MPFFTLEKQSARSRAGTITTSHGEVKTPAFMPVGTLASVKTMAKDDLQSLQAQVILANAYHLYLRPGHKLIEELGGLHQFMNWPSAILTDSGGYQVFSLGKFNKVAPEGVYFKSHLDGSSHFISPEKSMEIQKSLGSDLVMAFDWCHALPAGRDALEKSVDLTLDWAEKCRRYPLSKHQHLFAIVQGGPEMDLRLRCLSQLKEMDFAGFAIGGVSVGEKNEQMVSTISQLAREMPIHAPRYLMGVGTPLDILRAVGAGIDMFDCVLPTRNARNGQLFTPTGPINIKREEYKKDLAPPVPSCPCPLCQNHSRAYLRHLVMSGEHLAGRLITRHNLTFYLTMMEEVRRAIFANEFDKYYQNFYNRYSSNQTSED